MIEVAKDINATTGSVWRVLADGWLYPLWVVGASRVREVDDTWPQAGSKIHHSVGLWPAVLNDETEVLECVEERLIELKAKAWPGGEATVTLQLQARAPGTRVQMIEDVTGGPGRLVPRPLRAPVLSWRNHECLRRLAWLAERRG